MEIRPKVRIRPKCHRSLGEERAQSVRQLQGPAPIKGCRRLCQFAPSHFPALPFPETFQQGSDLVRLARSCPSKAFSPQGVSQPPPTSGTTLLPLGSPPYRPSHAPLSPSGI